MLAPGAWAAAIRARLHNVFYGFLFLPGAIALGFVGLAFLLTWTDSFGDAHGVGGFGGDAATARSILSTIATALITVSGLTFSITVVSLQLVSQQFSPRALRNFLGDRVTQLVAGAFVGIFAFCLLVLRTVREGNAHQEFVPGLSVSFAIGLGVITLGLLLAFIHHMSKSIQLSTIASGIARATMRSLDRLYPEKFGEPAPAETDATILERWRRREPSGRVFASRPGYIQVIALDELPHKLRLSRARVHVPVAPGDFVTSRTVLAEVWTADGTLDTTRIQSIFAVENERDVGQDVLYGLRQLADIAIRALSPGINDPTTARTCIGYMESILERLTERALPDTVRRYPEADVVMVARRHSYADYIEPLSEVSRHAVDDARVRASVAEAAARIAERARSIGADERRRTLRELATREAEARTSRPGPDQRPSSAPAGTGPRGG